MGVHYCLRKTNSIQIESVIETLSRGVPIPNTLYLPAIEILADNLTQIRTEG